MLVSTEKTIKIGEMQVIAKLRSHKEYIEFVDKHVQSTPIPKAHEDVFMRLKLLDLTPLRLLFLPLYCSDNGRPGYPPEDLMRSLIAMVLCGIYSIDEWVNKYLKDKHGFYAVISGFLPGETPSVGCLYNFMTRVLQLPKFCRDKNIRPKKKRLTKSEKEQLKDDKEKVCKRHVKIISKLAERFQRIHSNGDDVYIPTAEKIVNEILQLCCVKQSHARKLLDQEHLNISGDGTKLKVHANRYGKKICSCDSFSCDCPRFFNSTDASVGYDSYHGIYVYGYNFYQVNSWSFHNKSELPTYLMMVTGCRHDSVPGMFAMNRCSQMGYKIDNGCFDSAHDATDFYRLCCDMWNMNPFISLNTRNEGNTKNLPMSGMTSEGIPICAAGHQMYYYGHNKNDRDRIKWRCPIKAVKKNSNLECDFMDECSTSDYGRVVYTHPESNLRLYPPVARNSQQWKDTYKHRTSAERVFKREKNDFLLSSFRTRSKERYLFYGLLTAIAVHIDAWFRQNQLKEAA
jgi:hypothetical protein